MLILLNSDAADSNQYQKESFIIKAEKNIKLEVDDLVDDSEWTPEENQAPVTKLPTLRPKPATALLSEEAKKIFQTSAPQRRSSGNNPRAHKIVETPDGREYIPDTNSNNILHLEGIHPPPEASEKKKGYMLRPVGEITSCFTTICDFQMFPPRSRWSAALHLR